MFQTKNLHLLGCYRCGQDGSQVSPGCPGIRILSWQVLQLLTLEFREMSWLTQVDQSRSREDCIQTGPRGEVFSKDLFWDKVLLNSLGWRWLWGSSWPHLLRAGITACSNTLHLGGELVEGTTYRMLEGCRQLWWISSFGSHSYPWIRGRYSSWIQSSVDKATFQGSVACGGNTSSVSETL